MAFHFCAHSWEVRDLADGTLVKLSRRDLDENAVADLVDDLLDVVLKNGAPNLYLDFFNIGEMTSAIASSLVALNTELEKRRGRLVVLNVQPLIYDMLQAAGLTELLDIRPREAAETRS